MIRRLKRWRYRRSLRPICPHSLLDAAGTCQLCFKRGIDRRQLSARNDGQVSHD